MANHHPEIPATNLIIRAVDIARDALRPMHEPGRLISRYSDVGERPISNSAFCYEHTRMDRHDRAVGFKVCDDHEPT
jgi:hypothetical protein